MDTRFENPFHGHTVTLRIHRRQRLTQILLPVILASILFVGLIVLIIVLSLRPGGEQTHALWADISTIWLLLPMLFVALIVLAMVGALVFAVTYLIQKLPHYGALGQYYAYRMHKLAHKASEGVTAPVIKLRGWQAGWRAIRSRVRSRF